jgi:hypothetical protein
MAKIGSCEQHAGVKNRVQRSFIASPPVPWPLAGEQDKQ